MAFMSAAKALVARLFRLVDNTGAVVGVFSTNANGTGNPGLEFHHNTTQASAVYWSRSAVGNPNSVTLVGPTGTPMTSGVSATGGGGGDDTVSMDSGGIAIITANGTQDAVILSANDVEINPDTRIVVNGRTARMLVGNPVASGNGAAVPFSPAVITNIPNMTNTLVACKAGDLIKVTTVLTVARPAVTGFSFVQATHNVTNAVALAQTFGFSLMAAVGDWESITYTQWWDVTADGNCVATSQWMGTNLDYQLVAGTSTQIVELYATN